MRKAATLIFRKEDQANLELLLIASLIVFVLAIGLNELVRGLSYPALLGCGLIGLLLAWKVFSKTGNLVFRITVLILLGVIFSVLFLDEVGNAIFSWIGSFIRVVPILFSDIPNEGLVQLQQASVRVSFTFWILFSEVTAWWQDLAGGSGGYSKQATILIWNYVEWILAIWLGWAIRRSRRPFAVIVPVMIVITSVVAYIKAKTWILSIVMVICFMLVVFIQHYRREQDWERRSISYSEDIRLDILGITMVISFMLVILTMIIPSFSFRELMNTVRDLTRSDDSVTIAPAIGLYEVKEEQSGSSSQKGGVLPASQLIGNPPELAENIVMHVQANDAFVSNITDHPYWRSHTYEIYTGSGWLVGEVQLEQLNPQEELPLVVYPDNTEHQFTFTLYDNAEKRLYYTGQIITTTRPFGAIYRVTADGTQYDDFFAGLMEFHSYQAKIAWPSYSVETLSSSSQNYPDWIEERYLQLPSRLPWRLNDLAEQITRGARDPYAKASAIESYLRNYPYSLLISPPPEGQDVVDYFLFDAQEGYCDYFSTAMVVLSRAVGLPARLVVGYSSGDFDSDKGIFKVTEANAHSWVEIYFPDNGWVEFEPTSSRLLIDRASEVGSESVLEIDFSFPVRSTFIWREVGFGLIYSGVGIILIIVLAVGVDFYTLNRKSTNQVSFIFYRRLIWFALKSKMPYRASLTPFEFADHYIKYVRDLWRESRFVARIYEEGGKRIDFLTEHCVLAAYGEKPLGKAESRNLFVAWITLMPLLLISWVKTWFRRSNFKYSGSKT